MKFFLICLASFSLVSCYTSKSTPKTERVCVIVMEVRHHRGGASIRPRAKDGKATKHWFRYPSQNVNIGDTIEIDPNNRIEPKF